MQNIYCVRLCVCVGGEVAEEFTIYDCVLFHIFDFAFFHRDET